MFCCNPLKGRRRRKLGDWGEAWRVKVVVVGDERCGKTCLIQRHCQGTLPITYTPTLFDTSTTSCLVKGRTVQMVVQDTAGQEDLDRLRPPFYLHTDVVVICLPAAASADSWDKVRTVWLPEIRRYCGKHVPILLVANKADLVSSPDHPPPLDSTGHHRGVCDSSLKRLAKRLYSANPAFRAPHCVNTGDDVASKRSSTDSGIFGSTENLVPAGRSEEKHSSFKQRDSKTGERTSEADESRCDRRSVSSAKVEKCPSVCCGDGQKKCGGQCGSARQRGHSLASQIGAVGYFETSAVLNQGVDQVFQAALTAAMSSKQWRKKYRV